MEGWRRTYALVRQGEGEKQKGREEINDKLCVYRTSRGDKNVCVGVCVCVLTLVALREFKEAGS